MELSPRQQQILDIVKAQQPLSGEKIAEELGISNGGTLINQQWGNQ